MKELIIKHKGAVLGGLLGLIIAVLILIIGFWKALLVLFLVGVGIILGMAIDGNNMIKNSIDRFKSK